ncbi:hypothetical protein BJ085DRAFT_39540 [Dimargaris cristalligena]|uniref:Uncharacterized protein n=1 Tax=Dimargaris cristalligena TaxID=215637 RepID=A0A4P9ZLL3_9FUNG|nr:hypothetical protein BJ085DRAFT_39540 [Dimargaris cristalligena]|eukprot:RKP34015.1 hypothetical protein BJ085DRAFT_39540 [Dimargaris cristalligena]
MVAQLWGRLTILPRSVRPGLSLAFPWVSTSTRSIRLPISPIHQSLPGLLLNRARGNDGTSSLIACMHTDAPVPATTVQAEDKGTSSPPDHSDPSEFQ